MSKKRVALYMLLVLTMVVFVEADTTGADNNPKEYVDFVHRYNYDKDIHPNQAFLPIELLERFLVKNSKVIEMERINDDIGALDAEKTKQSLGDLKRKIEELKSDKSDAEDKISDIEDALDFDLALPPGHPLKMTPEARFSLDKQKEQLSNAIDAYNDNIRDMKENYVLLDFKASTELINTSYHDVTLDAFIENEKQSLNNKILDLLDAEASLSLKINEFDFMRELYKKQEDLYRFGYIDKAALLAFQSSIDGLALEIKDIKADITNKHDELEIITGLGYVFGIKLERGFFDKKLLSDSYRYYSDEFQKSSYQIPLLDEQISEMREKEEEIRKKTSKKLDADIIKLQIENAFLSKEALVEGVESASFKLLAGYDKVELEKSKIEVKIREAERKYSDNLWKYNHGYISKLDLEKSGFEVTQLKSSIDVLDLKLLRIKKTLDAMARGVLQK